MGLDRRLRRLEARTRKGQGDELDGLSDEELLARVSFEEQRLLAHIREAGSDPQWSPDYRDIIRRCVMALPGVRSQLSNSEGRYLGMEP